MTTKLKETLDQIVVALTDKIEYFPCIVGRPRSEFPNTSRHYIRKEFVTLFVATDNRTYNNIIENIYEALTDCKKSFDEIENSAKEAIFDKLYNSSQRNALQSLKKPKLEFDELIEKFSNEYNTKEIHNYDSKFKDIVRNKYIKWKIDNYK